MRVPVVVSIFAVAATLAIGAVAQPSPNFLIATRKGAMNLQGKYFGPVLAMARGTTPYDAKVVQRNADYLLVISQMPWEDFQPQTLGLPNTRAKEAIAKEQDKFKELVDTLQSDQQKLASAARAGDQAAVKSAAQAIGRTCNSCHENFTSYEFRFKLE
jgi:cytochrome c556